jgi:ribulose-5-phosphate 4-epimerase/fuculose-1-phosphate aldolase
MLIPELSPRAEVALLARALFREGYDDGIFGHMTYRQPDDTFLILPAEFGWNEARPDDILRIDIDANVLEGSGTVTPPIILHLEYHKLHTKCIWTVHQHPRYATVWSALGRIPPVYSQKGASLGDSIGLYDDYEGSVEGRDAARSAAAAVGDKTAVLLRNHGVFVVGDDVRQVFGRAVNLEGRCRIAWQVEAVGGGREMPEYGQQALRELSKRAFNGRSPGMWEWAVRRELRADPTLMS